MTTPFKAPLPSKPLPVLLPVCLSAATLVYQNANLLAEHLIQRHTGTQTTIKRFGINPFKAKAVLTGVEVSDRKRHPLVSFPSLTIELSGPQQRKRCPTISITAPSMLVTAVLLSSEKGTQTNWSQLSHTLQNTQMTPSSTRSHQSFEQPNQPTPPLCNYAFTVSEPTVSICTESNKFLIPPTKLPRLHLTTAHVSDASAIAHLADDIVARVIKQTGPREFPKEFRSLARKWTHKISNGAMDDAINWSQTNMGVLRRRVRQVDDVVKDLPGMDPVQSWTSRIDTTLGKFQRAISNIVNQEESPTDDNDTLGPPDGTDKAKQPGPSIDQRFRELDEDYP